VSGGPTPAETRGLSSIQHELETLADPSRAVVMQRFFKTGPGQYGEGDRFLGIAVPTLRRLARTHLDLTLPDVATLLRSEWHEARFLALLILVRQYPHADASQRREIYRFYLKHRRLVNNWDLVDCSAEHIVGSFLRDSGDQGVVDRLARSPSVWDRRIAIISTFHSIKHREYEATLRLARTLLKDPHDLIHKAVGWMLREIGKRDQEIEERFLQRHAAVMPRTMLRYAIERFPPTVRRRYLEA
jgi:3-methyladenine DNA glycosylase AlkD